MEHPFEGTLLNSKGLVIEEGEDWSDTVVSVLGDLIVACSDRAISRNGQMVGHLSFAKELKSIGVNCQSEKMERYPHRDVLLGELAELHDRFCKIINI
jgi:hypothetical protein